MEDKLDEIIRRIDILEKRLDEFEKNKFEQSKPDNELILAQANDLVVASGKKVAREVYSKIISHINAEVAPKVNSMLEYIAIATEDGSETTEMYQRRVQSVEDSRIAGLITASDSQMDRANIHISPYVSIGLRPR